MNKRLDNDQYSEQEGARRRDEVLRHMISRPPTPHKPLRASKSKTRPSRKGRVRKGKSRA